MRRQAALLIMLLAPIASCKKVACALGLLSTDTGCRIDTPAPCEDGTVRHSDGSCKAPYGYEVRDGEDIDVSDDTDVGETGFPDLDTDFPGFDTSEPPVEHEPCDYEIRIHATSWSSEIGFQFLYGDTVLFVIEPGDLNTNDHTYSWPLPNVGPGAYRAVMFDSAADGWHGGSYDIVHLASGAVVSTGALASGSLGANDVTLTCAAPPR